MTPFKEYKENMKHIKQYAYSDEEGRGFTVYEVDSDNCTFFGSKIKDLGAYGHKKFENILVMRDSNTRLKFRYV